jgi:hypothetical protein
MKHSFKREHTNSIIYTLDVLICSNLFDNNDARYETLQLRYVNINELEGHTDSIIVYT